LYNGIYNTPKYSLGDYVWNERNKESKQESTEIGIKEEKVTLQNEKWEEIGTTKKVEHCNIRLDNLEKDKDKIIF
ncbi:hypothetical protein EV43_15260, partial [Staphylococcus aureus]